MTDTLDLVRSRSAKAATAVTALERLRGLVDVAPLAAEVESWMVWLVINRGFSDNTLYAYVRNLVEWLEWCQSNQVDWQEATASNAEAWSRYLYAARGLAPKTRNLMLAGMRSFYQWRAKEGRGACSAGEAVNSRTDKRLPQKYSVNETRRLSEACDRSKPIGVRDHAILQLALGAGLRRSEISACDLTWLQLNQRSGTIRVQGKGAKERAIGISEPVVRALQAWLAIRADIVATSPDPDFEAVFVNLPAHVRGKRLGIRSVNTTLERLAKTAKLPITGHVHKLRTTFATEVYKFSHDIKRVQYLLGHSDINTTEVYIALAESELKAGMPTDVINNLTGGTADEQKLPAWYTHRKQ